MTFIPLTPVRSLITSWNVHPLQRLLHLLQLAGRLTDMIGAQSLIVLQAPNFRRRNKPASQQSMRMQSRQPLGIAHVGLAAR